MFGNRLRLARKKAGHSLRGLSEAMGGAASPGAIGEYERTNSVPGSDVLIPLMEALDVTLHYLFCDLVEGLEEVEFRKRANTKAADRARVEVEVIDALQRHLVIEEILEIDGGGGPGNPPWPESRLKHEDEGESLADQLRRRWGLATDPIPDMTSLLEDRGLKVLAIALPDGVSGLTCLARVRGRKSRLPVIVVNKDIGLERLRFTLAHELAHRVIDDRSPVDHERAANIFAGAFLVPKEHLRHAAGGRRQMPAPLTLIKMKRMYRVSAAMLLMRLRQAAIIDHAALSQAFRTFARDWRTNEPAPLHGAEGQEIREMPRRFERLCYRALREGIIGLPKACELLKKPCPEVEGELKAFGGGDSDSHQ